MSLFPVLIRCKSQLLKNQVTPPMPPERFSRTKKKRVVFYALVGIMYMTDPSAIDPIPTHHHLSALKGSDGF